MQKTFCVIARNAGGVYMTGKFVAATSATDAIERVGLALDSAEAYLIEGLPASGQPHFHVAIGEGRLPCCACGGDVEAIYIHGTSRPEAGCGSWRMCKRCVRVAHASVNLVDTILGLNTPNEARATEKKS